MNRLPEPEAAAPRAHDRRLSSILFDLDGTIADTLPLCMAAFRDSINAFAGRPVSDDEIKATFGPTEEGTLTALVPHARAAALRRYLERYEALHDMCPGPFEGIPEVLDFLKKRGVFIGLITGKGPRSADLTLARYGLKPLFDTIKTGAASGAVKDQRIEEVIAEFSLDRDKILYVGDWASDIHASRDCRIQVAAAAWAPGTDADMLATLKPDYLFHTVAALFGFLREVFPDPSDRQVAKSE